MATTVQTLIADDLRGRYLKVNTSAATIAVATTDVFFSLVVDGYEEFGCELKNTGAVALDAFEIDVQFTSDGAFVPVASIAGDFSTPLWPLRRSVGAPVTLGAGITAAFFLNVRGIYAIQFKASSAVSTTTCIVNAMCQ